MSGTWLNRNNSSDKGFHTPVGIALTLFRDVLGELDKPKIQRKIELTKQNALQCCSVAVIFWVYQNPKTNLYIYISIDI